MSSETKVDDAIVTECDLDDEPGKVWRALTEPELTAAWLVPENVDCKIIEAEPERLLRCSWRSRGDERDAQGARLDTIVTFELSPAVAGGTHLRIVHEGFATARAARALGVLTGSPQRSISFCASDYPKTASHFSVRCDNDNNVTMMRAA